MPKALICCQRNQRQDLLQIHCSRDPDLHLFMKTEDKAAVGNAFTPSETYPALYNNMSIP